MIDREQAVRALFRSWIDKDITALQKVFDPQSSYIESWGPAYNGFAQITQWFHEWNASNSVVQWDITRFFHQGDVCICEWFFRYEGIESAGGFNGVSIVEFSMDNKIVQVREFQSKTPNYFPYG